MMQYVKDRLDQFLGRGQSAVTVPSLDGALKPNNLLETAASGILGDTPDNLVALNGRPIWSDGARLIREDGEVLHIFDSAVTALAVSVQGEIAVALAAGDIRILDVSGKEKLSHNPKGLTGITAMEFEDAGTLLLCIGSTRHTIDDWARDLLERQASGQLCRLSIESGSVEVLSDGLAYPNGVLVLPDGGLAVSESWKSRLIRFDPGTEKSTPLVEDLPAYPGRISAAKGGGYWLALFAPRSPLIEFVLREPTYRRAMMAEVDPEFWIAPTLKSGYSFHEPMQGGALKQMGILKPWAPTRSYGLIVHLDSRFVPLRSFHSRAGGRRHGITSALDMGDALWLTSRGGGETFPVDLSAHVLKEEAQS
ncbi:MAG: strictosidine synthase [Alphaproteobacteria bacterium]|nr:MAG: strictosidine synthase [Alphaproteobacteria bacterium]